ncbi:MAG: polysaccharide deacetylase family protein [candidate division KSB1 bacterium]|nr:polysaccharide deacetylase family protein [candidate division KSB1 bacterium]
MKQIHQQGNQIEIHGFQHERLFHQSIDYLSQQLGRSKSAVEAVIGEQVQFFRPPFGIFSPRLLNMCTKLRLKMVLWSLMLYDFDIKLSDRFIISLAHQKVTEGDIILLHDGHLNSYRTVRILSSMIQHVKKKGLKFGLITK